MKASKLGRLGLEVGVVHPASPMTRAVTESVDRVVDDITIAARERRRTGIEECRAVG
jgi:hypothetical protein